MKTKSHLRETFLIILASILCLSLMSGCTAKGTSPSSSSVASGTAIAKPLQKENEANIAIAKPRETKDESIVVTGDDFLQEFLMKPAASRKKYEDKTVLLSGTVLVLGDSKSLSIPAGPDGESYNMSP